MKPWLHLTSVENKLLMIMIQYHTIYTSHFVHNCTLMAFREPLNNMLWDETSVHTGLSWARIVLTFCRVWMSHTYTRHTAATRDTQQKDDEVTSIACANNSNCASLCLKRESKEVNVSHNDGAVCRATI